MLDLKKAYETLGLSETAAEEELERRYLLLLKRNRRTQADGQQGEDGSGPSMEEISQAYNYIKNFEKEQIVLQNTPKNKKVERAGHIWEYYRFHIIGAILAVVVLVYTVTTIVENRKADKLAEMADVKITFFGDFMVQDTEPFKVKLLSHFTDWKSAMIYSQYAPLEAKSEFDVGMQQKAVISMGYEMTDVYIMDPVNFERYGLQGGYLKLSELPGLESVVPEAKKRKLKPEDDAAEGWYGVNLSSSAALKELPLPPGDKIAAVRHNAKNKENAARAIEWLLQE